MNVVWVIFLGHVEGTDFLNEKFRGTLESGEECSPPLDTEEKRDAQQHLKGMLTQKKCDVNLPP